MPSVLFVDDEPDEVGRYVDSLENNLVSAKAVHPQDVTLTDLREASLVLVDSRLDNWPDRDALGNIALQPANGMALAVVLKSHVEDVEAFGLRAFALFTAHLKDYSPGVSVENREHALARFNSLEWAFQKTTELQTLTKQFSILAAAAARLPKKWPLADSAATQQMLRELLGINEERNWAERALFELESCHPPVRELSDWSHGIEVLRWMLHRIMPYPSFLWDEIRLAARMRITVPSLMRVLNAQDDLSGMISECEYTGITKDFLGRRWWRAGIESMLWELAGDTAFDIPALVNLYGRLSAQQIEAIPVADPVVCVDENNRPTPGFCDLSATVRLVVDDWPSYADPPRASLALVKEHREMSAAVLPEDQERLHDEPDNG
jgi:hypothetical protein